MKKRSTLIFGLPAILLVFSLVLAGCDDPNKESSSPPPVVPPTLTGTVAITGFPKVTGTLTANIANLGGSGTVSYVWKRGTAANAVDTVINGAAASIYQPTTDDLGKFLTVTVSRAGYSGSITSAATAAVASSGTAAPTVNSVTVSPLTATVVRGGTTPFSAVVNGTGITAAYNTVTWSITTLDINAGTTINSAGVLTVALGETKTSLTVKATSTLDTTKSHTATVTVAVAMPTVTSVTVEPETVEVAKGGTEIFYATVEGNNSPSQSVTWSIVETERQTGTTITTDPGTGNGVLTVASNETLVTLTVKATSTVNVNKSGEATVTVINPSVISVTVSPNPVNVWKGGTKTFRATVAVTGSLARTVTWSITTGGINVGTTIDETTGVLTVAAEETKPSLTIKATSTVDVNKSGQATVSVTDGMTWTAVASSPTNIGGIAWGANKFVAGGSSIAYSSDGITWYSSSPSSISFGIFDIAWGGPDEAKVFVAVGYGGKMAYSLNGSNWYTNISSPFGSSNINGIAWGGGAANKFVAVGSNGKMAYSSNGTSWQPVGSSPFGDSDIITGVAWGNGTFVAVGDGGKMATSTNGTSWQPVTTTATFYANDIVWGGDKFVAVGNSGKMAYSENGTSWTAVLDSTFGSSSYDKINSIAWDGDTFVAVGDGGKMAYSSDGITWRGISSSQSTFSGYDIKDIASGNNKFVAVGSTSSSGIYGKIAYSN